MDTPNAILPSTGHIDLRALTSLLVQRRTWIAISVLVVTAIFGIAAFAMTPVYRASVVAMPAGSERSALGSLGSAFGELGGLAALAGIEVGGDTDVEESLAVLESRAFTEAFIREMNIIHELFADKWDAKAERWKGDQEDWPTYGDAAKYFGDQVRSLDFNRKSGLVTLSIEWRDPAKAATWANEMLARVNEEMRARAIARTSASIGFLEKELASTSAVDTRATINRLIGSQINERMFANVTHEYALRVVDRAMAPEPDDVVRPKRGILLALGLGFGILVGCFVALLGGPPTPK